MKIKAGCGYWQIDHYSIGGCFGRAGVSGLEIREPSALPRNVKGCTHTGKTLDGNRVAFDMALVE